MLFGLHFGCSFGYFSVQFLRLFWCSFCCFPVLIPRVFGASFFLRSGAVLAALFLVQFLLLSGIDSAGVGGSV